MKWSWLMQARIKGILSNVLMSAKFCNVFVLKVCLVFMAISQPSDFACTLCLSISQFHVHFYARIIMHRLGITLSHENGLWSLEILILKMRIKVFVMIMVLMRMAYGWMGIGFIWQYMVILVMVTEVTTTQPYTMGNCQSNFFLRKGIGKVSRSVKEYAYLVCNSQV